MEFKVYPKKKSPRVFKSKLMESLTKSNIVVIDALYIVVGFLLVVTYWVNFKPTVLDICLWFVFGLVSWSFFEYFLHRFLYHKIKDASYDIGFQYLFHGIHHKYPHDNDRLVLPVVPSLIGIPTHFVTNFIKPLY